MLNSTDDAPLSAVPTFFTAATALKSIVTSSTTTVHAAASVGSVGAR